MKSAYQYVCMYKGTRYRDIHVLRVATGIEETAYQRGVELKKGEKIATIYEEKKKETLSRPDSNAGTDVPR